MKLIEIIVIVSSILIVLSVIARYIYKKVKHIPTNECNCYHAHKMKKAFKDIRSELDKEMNNECCCHH